MLKDVRARFVNAVIAMTTPGHALYFGGYELTKRILSPSDGSEVPWVHFVSGMSAEVCGGLLWCPMVGIDGPFLPHPYFDPQWWAQGLMFSVVSVLCCCLQEVIKQRIQIKRTALGGSAPTTLATCRDVLAESGVRGFFRVGVLLLSCAFTPAARSTHYQLTPVRCLPVDRDSLPPV